MQSRCSLVVFVRDDSRFKRFGFQEVRARFITPLQRRENASAFVVYIRARRRNCKSDIEQRQSIRIASILREQRRQSQQKIAIARGNFEHVSIHGFGFRVMACPSKKLRTPSQRIRIIRRGFKFASDDLLRACQIVRSHSFTRLLHPVCGVRLDPRRRLRLRRLRGFLTLLRADISNRAAVGKNPRRNCDNPSATHTDIQPQFHDMVKSSSRASMRVREKGCRCLLTLS